MTDNAAPAPDAPGGTPSNSGDTSGTGGSFVRARTAQMTETMRPAPSDNAPPDQRQQQAAPPDQRTQTQQQSPGEHGKYTAEQIDDAMRFKTEHDVRRQALPQPSDYKVKLPDNWQPPVGAEGAKIAFDGNAPQLQRMREMCHAASLDQLGFEALLGEYASTLIGGQMKDAQSREANLRQLGPAAPQRVQAVQTWLKAVARKNGELFAGFLAHAPSHVMTQAVALASLGFALKAGSGQNQLESRLLGMPWP
jgi:hypothetical protein